MDEKIFVSFKTFIYCYRHKLTNIPVYVGQSTDTKRRDRRHCLQNKIPFDRYLTKHGRENFVLETLETVNSDNYQNLFRIATERENFWMTELKTWYGHETGGQNFLRSSFFSTSEERDQARRAAISAANRGRKASLETRQKMSRSRSGEKAVYFGVKGAAHPGFGRRHSPEIIQKIANANRGRKASPETLLKLRESHLGQSRPMSDKTKEKLRLINRGRKFSETHIQKLKESHKGHHPSPETLIKKSESMKAAWARRKQKNIVVAEAA